MNVRYVFINTALGFTVCSGAAGLAVFVPEWKRQAGVKRCVAASAALDPRSDASRDFHSGERRFFFVNHNGISMTTTADGVPASSALPSGKRECELKRMGDFKPLALSAYAAYAVRPGMYCCDSDPPRTACGKAIDAYVYAYNAEMARISPRSVKDCCG